jgi:hypothetical protein
MDDMIAYGSSKWHFRFFIRVLWFRYRHLRHPRTLYSLRKGIKTVRPGRQTQHNSKQTNKQTNKQQSNSHLSSFTMTNITNTTNTSKPSTVETLKDKATHLVNKVTGKGHSDAAHSTDSHAITTDQQQQQQQHHEHPRDFDGTSRAQHGDVIPGTSLTSVRLPHEGAGGGMASSAVAPNEVTQPEAVHDPNYALPAGQIPTHAANVAPHANIVGDQEPSHHQQKQHHHHHHRADDPQHASTPHLAGENVGGDPNSMGSSAPHPVM